MHQVMEFKADYTGLQRKKGSEKKVWCQMEISPKRVSNWNGIYKKGSC
jgi:hypothetical protein